MSLLEFKEGWMEKNEVGCVVVCVQDNYIRIRKVLTPKKNSVEFSAIKDFFEFTNLFGIGVQAQSLLAH